MSNSLFSVLISLLFIGNSVSINYDWRCTKEFCRKEFEDCKGPDKECLDKVALNRAIIIPSMKPCSCCDECLMFQAEGEDCIKTLNREMPKYICEPGYTCNKNRKCEKMKGQDPHFFPNYVCKNGECHCAIMGEDGKVHRIFGKFQETEMNKNEKQCDCSVTSYKAKKGILRALPFEGIYQPSVRCLKNGQYDSLQCIGSNCGCVERDTGIPDKKGFKYAIQSLEKNHPTCFDPSRHTKGRYYTDCEKKRNQLMKVIHEGSLQNKNIILFESINCNPDGSYYKPDIFNSDSYSL